MGSDIRAITVRFGTLAEEYERVHFVHHYLYNENLTAENLKPYANKIADQFFDDTGYMAFVREINVHHYPLFTTDVDFVIDAPATSPIAPAVIVAILKAIALIIVAIAILGIVVLLYVTIYTEKYKRYICEQDPDYPSFEGWAAYMGHLKEKHPAKYEGAVAAGSTDWFTKPAMAIGGLLVLGLIGYGFVTRERRRE